MRGRRDFLRMRSDTRQGKLHVERTGSGGGAKRWVGNVAHPKTRIPDAKRVRQPQNQCRHSRWSVRSAFRQKTNEQKKSKKKSAPWLGGAPCRSGYPTNVVHDGERPDIGYALLVNVRLRLYEHFEPDTKVITRKTSELAYLFGKNCCKVVLIPENDSELVMASNSDAMTSTVPYGLVESHATEKTRYRTLNFR